MKIEDIYTKGEVNNSISSIDLESITEIAKKKTEFSSWQDSYWVMKSIDKFANEDASNDEYLILLLKNAFQTGLNYESNINKFFESVLVYIKLQFKYRQYREVENYLMLLRELKFPNYEIPNWVYQFSAVTYYKLGMKLIFSNPDDFIDTLNQLAESTEEEKRKKIYVIKDFISEATLFESENQVAEDKKKRFITIFEKFINPYFDEVNTEWMEFVDPDYLPIEIGTEAKPGISESLDLAAIIDKLNSDIIARDNEILDLLGRIDELTEKTRTLENENTNLVETLNNKSINPNRIYENQISLPASNYIPSSNRDIVLIIGASRISIKDIHGIGKDIGFSKDQLVIYDDYGKNEGFDFTKLKHSSKYCAILYGPNAHSTPGKGNYSSALEMLKNEEGYPPVFEIRNESDTLKITKSSLKKTLQKAMNHIQAKA